MVPTAPAALAGGHGPGQPVPTVRPPAQPEDAMTTPGANVAAPFVDTRARRTGNKDASGHLAAQTALRPARSHSPNETEGPAMSQEMTQDQIYAMFFGPDGQPSEPASG